MNRRSEAMKNRKKGFFTLVEIIVAMAIMIFVALIIASASMTFYNAWQRSVRISERLKTYQEQRKEMVSAVQEMLLGYAGSLAGLWFGWKTVGELKHAGFVR